MNETEITFLSSRGRGLKNDLALLKDYLAKQSGEDVKLRYYLNNERHKNPLAAHGLPCEKGFYGGYDKCCLCGCFSIN